jgi:ABC-type sugar transport system ATPase subunit
MAAPMSGRQGLTLTSVTKSYGPTKALRGVSLSFSPGEVHTLLGENGSGKSTLVKILSGVVRIDSGAIHLGGDPLVFGSPSDSLRSGIATAFQELTVLPALTVAENLFLNRYPRRWSGTIGVKALNREADQLFEEFELELSARTPCRELSLAQLQLLEVARAVSRRPRILILDEATSALDAPEARQVMTICRKVSAGGTTVIFVSHRLDEVLEISDRVSTLVDGRIGSTREGASISHDALLNELVGHRHTVGVAEVTGEARAAKAARPPQAAVRARFEIPASAGFRNDLQIELRQGEILGLAGLQGHGQKRVLRILGGDVSGHGTQHVIDGHTIRARTPREAIANGVYYIPEERKVEGILTGHSISTNMTLSSLDRLTRFSWIRRSLERQLSKQTSVRLGVRLHSLRDTIDSLSGGNQQKVVLGRGLLSQPKVLLLDDSMRGIDVRAKNEIYRLLAELAGEGTSIILNSTEIPELTALCSRILVFHDQDIFAELEADQVSESNILRAMFGRTEERAA